MVVAGSTETIVVTGATVAVAGFGMSPAVTRRIVCGLDHGAGASSGTSSGAGIRGNPFVSFNLGFQSHLLAEEVARIICGATVITVGRYLDGRCSRITLTTLVVLLRDDQVCIHTASDASIVGQVIPVVMNVTPVPIGRGGTVIDGSAHTVIVVI